jgi:hypothetical protein
MEMRMGKGCQLLHPKEDVQPTPASSQKETFVKGLQVDA